MSKTKTAQAASLEQLQSAGVGVARATAWLQRECESAGRNGGFNAEGDLANIIRTGNSLRGWLIGLRDALETKGIRASLRAANPDAPRFADEVGESYLEAIFLAGERNFITLSMLCRHGVIFDYLSHLLPQSAVTLKGDIEPIPLWAPLPAPESIEYVKGTGGALRTPAFLVGRIFQEIGELPRVNADHATRFINKELERASFSREPSGDKSDTEKPVDLNVLEILLGDFGKEFVAVASRKGSADPKMRDLYRLDPRVLAWESPMWAKVLRVTDAAVRLTKWWRVDRKQLMEEQEARRLEEEQDRAWQQAEEAEDRRKARIQQGKWSTE